MVRYRHAIVRFAAPVSWRGQPASLAADLRRHIKRVIKQTPWLWRLAADVRSRIGSKSLPALRRAARSTPSAADAGKKQTGASLKDNRAKP